MTLNSLVGHVTPSYMSPISKECTSSYPDSIVTFALYRTVSDIFLILCQKNCLYHSPSPFRPKIGELPLDLDSWASGG